MEHLEPSITLKSLAVAGLQTQLTDSLPEELRSSLPTIEEIEAELGGHVVNY